MSTPATRTAESPLGDVTHPAGGFRHPSGVAQEGNVTAPQPPPGPAAPAPRTVRSWPILLLAAPAFVAIWSGWVGLGELTGFGPVKLLPGIWDRASINSAITLPVGMETYAAYALHVMLSARVGPRARTFARWSALGSLVLGAAGQVAYHLMSAARIEHAPWQITALVACLPVAVLGMGAALAHLVHEDTPDASGPAERDGSELSTRRVDPGDTSAAALGDGSAGPARAGARARTTGQATRAARPTTTARPAKPAGTDTAAKVARLLAERPDLTQAEVAKRAGVSVRTVRRYWTASRPTTPAETTPAETTPAETTPAETAPTPIALPATDPDGPAPTTTDSTQASDSVSRAA